MGKPLRIEFDAPRRTVVCAPRGSPDTGSVDTFSGGGGRATIFIETRGVDRGPMIWKSRLILLYLSFAAGAASCSLGIRSVARVFAPDVELTSPLGGQKIAGGSPPC
jgi:hypothetical protein